MNRYFNLLAIITMIGFSHISRADIITIDFTASDFMNSENVLSSPYDQISGSISYVAATPSSFADYIVAIDLNIGGYQYMVNELVFDQFDASHIVIGGVDTGANGFSLGSDDFMFIWDFVSQGPNIYGDTFTFTTSSVSPPDFWYSTTFNYSVSVSPIPIPAAAWLFTSGLIGLIGMARCCSLTRRGSGQN